MPSVPEQFQSYSMPTFPFGAHGSPKVLERHQPERFMSFGQSPLSNEKIARMENLVSSVSTYLVYDLEKKTPDPAFEEVRKPKMHAAVPRSISTPLLLLSPRSWIFRGRASRPWIVTGHHVAVGDNADVVVLGQVKSYMPPLYWAGRFQSRFDQWRTEAMKVELDPLHEVPGHLEQCKLSEENAAACQIFLQLRDLCISNQAADSLWVSLLRVRIPQHKLI